MTASSSTSKAPDDQEADPTTEAAAPGEATPDTSESDAEAADPGGVEGETTAPTADVGGETAAPTSDVDVDERAGDEPAETARRGPSSVVTGAAAVVSAGLGLASLTGTWLSDLMSSRQELIGQINSGQTSPPAEQVAAIYGSPWHTEALFNGFFALAAILVAGAALIVPAIGKSGEESPTWVRAVAFAGLALGTIGLVIAAVMWFDVFTELPAVPEAPVPPG
jgi:hypothetical protein